MTIAVVLADANILFSRTLRDYVLYAAEAGAIEVRWSQQILDEMSRNLQGRLGLSQADTDRLERLMNVYLDEALVEVEADDLAVVIGVAMDVKDRHVLAAALSANADILVTENVRHFPRTWMAEHDIELLTARQLLARLAEAFPDEIRRAHHRTVRYSPKTEADILATLEGLIGTTVTDLIRAIAALPAADLDTEAEYDRR